MGLRTAITSWFLKGMTAEQVGGMNIAPWQSNRPYYPPTDYRKLVARYAGWVYACAHKNAIMRSEQVLRGYGIGERGV